MLPLRQPTLSSLAQEAVFVDVVHTQALADGESRERTALLHHAGVGDGLLGRRGEGRTRERELADTTVQASVEDEAFVWAEGHGGDGRVGDMYGSHGAVVIKWKRESSV